MQKYDIQKMQELLHDFYNLTGIRICLYDSAEEELCSYPEKHTEFCRHVRNNPALDMRCSECDRLAFATCKKTHKRHVYTCHAGLLECFSPILYNDNIIGYIVIGQIKMSEQTDFGSIANRFSAELQRDLEQYFNSIASFGTDKINSAIHILDACASYEYLKNLINAAESRIDATMGAYINDHLAEDLSVPLLCSHFHLSKSELYSIFKEYFNSSVADFIQKRRLNRACTLLETTSLPVNKIAEQCGIPDYNYFSKVFKRTFQISPREYREKIKKSGL